MKSSVDVLSRNDETDESPLRILMVLHMPWDRNLGGPRVQLELADEFRALGHVVEKFDVRDAFAGQPPRSRLDTLLTGPLAAFAPRAVAHVRQNSHRFDIVDAHHGNLPATKKEMGFDGLLVARSVGLAHFYEAFSHEEARLWPGKTGSRAGRLLRRRRERQDLLCANQSLRRCDLVNVCNADEAAYVRDVIGRGSDDACVSLPFGLTAARRAAFVGAARPAAERHTRQEIAFVGAWGLRKGAGDWGRLVRAVRDQAPSARFLFLGTGRSEAEVCGDLGLPPADWIKVVPRYQSDELPDLLAASTVGAFPSYIEGFPFAIMEKMAAGLPTVAYDVPGPREMLRLYAPSRPSLLTPRGDAEAMAARLAQMLALPLPEYAGWRTEASDIAGRFSWPEIARTTLRTYRWGLAKIRAGEKLTAGELNR